LKRVFDDDGSQRVAVASRMNLPLPMSEPTRKSVVGQRLLGKMEKAEIGELVVENKNFIHHHHTYIHAYIKYRTSRRMRKVVAVPPRTKP
jgi:hypothetical protein